MGERSVERVEVGQPQCAEPSSEGARALTDLHRSLDRLPAGAYTCDLQGRITYFNARAAELWGRRPKLNDPGDLYCGSLRLFATDGTPLNHQQCWMARALHENREYSAHEIIVERPDGSRRTVLAHACPLLDDRGIPISAVNILIDITDQRRAEQDRERERADLLDREQSARADAERASHARSEFLATLSHELRTPLTPVLLTVSLLESHPALPEELRADVATIRRNVELESRLISDLIDLTRIERGRLKLDEQQVDLHRVVRSAIDICQREASVKLDVDLRAEHHTVRGDGTRLQQVFWNLINNAAKFSGADGTVLVRSFDAADPGDGVARTCVEVSDTGVGIDPAVLPRLFSAFEQGEARVGKQRAGLGLGLAISRRLVEEHGGTISARSEGRGMGATFAVCLPVIPEEHPAPDQPPDRPELVPSAEQQPRRTLGVLLVEDHEPTLLVLTKLLRQLGHRVTGATTVASAAAAALHEPFDLVISDLGLPDGSGLDLIRVLREQYSGRAIALTGYGMDSDIAASTRAGFAEHLTKPVDLAALESAITRVSNQKPTGNVPGGAIAAPT